MGDGSFSPDFKQTTVQRILTGEKTVAELWTASPRPLTGADIRTLMDRTLWARFGEATLKAPHAIQWYSQGPGRNRETNPWVLRPEA